MVELQAEIDEYLSAAEDARAKNQHAPAIAAMKSATSLRATLASHRAELAAMQITDPVLRLRDMRMRASADASWVAAASLYKEEVAAQREQDEERRRREEEAARSEDAILADIDSALSALPPALREKVIGKWRR